jgi:hypothetical protein
MSIQQQKDILHHTFNQLTEFCGKPPVGSVAPWWEVSKEGTEMLLDVGIRYGGPGLPSHRVDAGSNRLHAALPPPQTTATWLTTAILTGCEIKTSGPR